MPTPPRLRITSTLKNVLNEWETLEDKEILTLSDILESHDISDLFGISKTGAGEDVSASDAEEIAILFMQGVCSRYWYREIGFDIDEQFIEKLKATWSLNIAQYTRMYYYMLVNSPFARKKTGESTRKLSDGYTVKETYTPTLKTEVSGTNSENNNETVTGSGSDTNTQTLDTLDTDTRNLKDTTSGSPSSKKTTDYTPGITETVTNESTATNFGQNISETDGKNVTTRAGSDETVEKIENELDQTDEHTGTDTMAKTGTVKDVGSNSSTETTTGSKSGTNTSTTNETGNAVTDTTRTNTGSVDDSYTETEIDFSVDKLRLLTEYATVVDDFVDKFDKLFMQVYTDM